MSLPRLVLAGIPALPAACSGRSAPAAAPAQEAAAGRFEFTDIPTAAADFTKPLDAVSPAVFSFDVNSGPKANDNDDPNVPSVKVDLRLPLTPSEKERKAAVSRATGEGFEVLPGDGRVPAGAKGHAESVELAPMTAVAVTVEVRDIMFFPLVLPDANLPHQSHRGCESRIANRESRFGRDHPVIRDSSFVIRMRRSRVTP